MQPFLIGTAVIVVLVIWLVISAVKVVREYQRLVRLPARARHRRRRVPGWCS